jgi:hypothetical protein
MHRTDGFAQTLAGAVVMAPMTVDPTCHRRLCMELARVLVSEMVVARRLKQRRIVARADFVDVNPAARSITSPAWDSAPPWADSPRARASLPPCAPR